MCELCTMLGSLYTDVFFFTFSTISERGGRERKRKNILLCPHPRPLPHALAVNKSPAVFHSVCELKGSLRENIGSVNRLHVTQKEGQLGRCSNTSSKVLNFLIIAQLLHPDSHSTFNDSFAEDFDQGMERT